MRHLVIIISFIIVGCGDLDWNYAKGKQEVTIAIDAVKHISPNERNGFSEKSYNQGQYEISETSRLLIRYESLSKNMYYVIKERPMILAIDVNEGSSKDLELCPITVNWMMAASWYSAHPFSGGKWKPGGEFETTNCISEMENIKQPVDDSNEGSGKDIFINGVCNNEKTTCFNLTNWYNDYVLINSTNYGLILKTKNSRSNNKVSVFGDLTAYGPRISWFDM